MPPMLARKRAWRRSFVVLAGALAGVVVFALTACGSGDTASSPPNVGVPIVHARVPPPPVSTPSIRVLVGGDLLPHRPRLLPPERIALALAPLRPLFSEADATIANYEAATGDPRDLTEASRGIALAAPPGWLSEIARAKVTAVTAANNHACDLGEGGLDATLASANDAGLVAVGADARDPWQARVIAEKGGKRVCAVAWSTFVNEPIAGCVSSGKIAVASFRKRGMARITNAVTRARDAGCSAVIAILHGGDEYEPQVRGPRLQARRAAFAGADAVIIHHPHVPSPLEIIETPDGRRVPVFESVGNLVSNQGESWKMPYRPARADHKISLNAWTRLGVLADLRWDFPPNARPLLKWGYHLVWVDNEHAIHREFSMPKIEARLFDPVHDKALMDRLATDIEGPTALFTDPCWMEVAGARCD